MSDAVSAYIDRVSEEARVLLAGVERTYDAARKLWGLGMDGATDEALRDVAWPLWLIWGNLTDRVDGPGGDQPGAEEAASAEMRRAASEWLDSVSDPAARTAYLDRWVYEECGYERPKPDDHA